jgi:hypothetical protein
MRADDNNRLSINPYSNQVSKVIKLKAVYLASIQLKLNFENLWRTSSSIN